jgi:hypothetical protein
VERRQAHSRSDPDPGGPPQADRFPWGESDRRWRVLVSDPNPSRRLLAGRVIAECGVEPRWIEPAALLSDVDRLPSSGLAVVAPGGRPSPGNPGLDAIAALTRSGLTVICYEDGAQAWPLGVQCRALLAGASALLDSGSVHPLGFLPYPDTTNFSPPVVDRFNRLDAFMAARLLFGAPSKRQGDLQRVEVDLRDGSRVLTTRVVDFNHKDTVVEGKGDEYRFVDGIAVEGYQKSNMIEAGRSDLAYGILVREIPRRCDTLVARVIDVRGHTVTSAPSEVPTQAAID